MVKNTDDFADDDVQREIAARLRAHATTSSSDMAMPADVAARIRAALADEAGAAASPVQPHTVIPLPRRAPSSAPSAAGAGSVEDDFAHEHTVEMETSAPASPQRFAAPGPSASRETDAPASYVTSLDAARKKRTRLAGLGAAAATVVIAGSFGAGQMVADQGNQGESSTTFASKVRVTDSGRSYSHQNLRTQAASLRTSSEPDIKDSPEAQNRLGALVTPQGLQSCLATLNSTMAQNPKRIYADFGQYESQKAVIVVVEKADSTSEVWVVKGTCSRSDDKIAGPEDIQA